jgi:uroporphyrinogen decarboxylase
MTSVERVLTALRGGQPDRVPIVETGVDPRIARAIFPDCRDVADCLDRLDTDAVSGGPFYRASAPAADGTFSDEWGVTYKAGLEALPHPVRGPIRTYADAKAWRPPDPDVPGRLGNLPDMVRRYKGKRAIRFGHRAAFMWSVYLMGMDTLLEQMLTEPDTVHLVMDKVLEVNLRVARAAVRAGAEIVTLGDDYAHNGGPLMSPALFGEFILPRLTRMVDAVHEEGALVIKHTDGHIYPILDMIVSAGIDCLNPIDPTAGMDLGTVKRLVGDKVSLCGNIDVTDLLPHGTVEQVEAAVQRAIAVAAPGGGFLLASSNSIHSSCRPENFAAMVAAGRRFGEYSRP